MSPNDETIPKDRAPTRIQAVVRAVQLVRLIAARGGRTAAEIAEAAGLSRPTCYHLLNTLVDEGVLAKDRRRRYFLGPTVGALSDAFARHLAPPEHLLAEVHRLAETTGETAHLSGWRNGEVVVLASIEGSHAIRVAGLHRGFSSFAHARSAGKLLLALAAQEACEAYLLTHELQPETRHTIVQRDRLLTEFAVIRERGYALDEEEFREGVACVSAAVVENGVPHSALTLSAPVDRFRRRRADFIDAVVAAARVVSAPDRPNNQLEEVTAHGSA